MYLLDTNICIYLLKHNPPSVVEKFNALSPDDIKISVITAAELYFGARKSKKTRTRAVIDTFLDQFEVLPFDQGAAHDYADIRATLEHAGKVIGELDMLIAAHARSNNLAVVTNNLKEFDRVPKLRVVNWV